MQADGETLGGSDRVYTVLRQEILRLTLAPGARLDESALTARFAVSRTPVREALIRLAAEGLVHTTKGQGARVSALELSCLRAFFEALDLLQRSVTRLAAQRRTGAHLQQIAALSGAFDKAARDRDATAANEANFALHHAMAEAAQSDYLAQAYDRCMGDGLRLAFLCYSDQTGLDETLKRHLEQTMADHHAMVDAIRRGDADAAEAVAGAHVDLFRNRMSTALMATDTVRGIAAAGGGNPPL